MALLEDPTIQRILDEVNKAATGGIFGRAGNYIPSPTKAEPFHVPTPADDEPMFYPTPEMFTGVDFNPLVPLGTPSNFDFYGEALYKTMPTNVLSPYETTFNQSQMRTTSIVSSTNNDVLSDAHRHFEYPTVPPKITGAVPNLGLNLRATPPSDPLPSKTTNELSSAEPLDTATASIDFPSLPPNENEEIDPPHISSAGRIFYDPNPQIVQRKGSNSVTYKQNIIVRFLQPPPIPNAGPLVIKEVSSQQQAPLPPLVIKQRPTPPKTPPPIIIREKPPPLPASLATKVITRHLPPEPAPPRAVIIERLPPLPPKPRDIIIERWLPYEIVNQKRKVIVERVQKTGKEHPQPKNVIITYEPVHAKIERHFQTQNVVREDPQEYFKRFGEQLFDTDEVFRQARSIGVLEDLNPPAAFFRNTTNNVAVGTDYDLTNASVIDEHVEKLDERPEEEEIVEERRVEEEEEIEEEEILPAPPCRSPVVEVTQDEDILVEENVTPFYINSGENLEETLHRLGIDIPKHMINEQTF